MSKTTPTSEPRAELEIILMIVSGDPGSTVRKVSSLTSVGDYGLIAQPARTLHDIYVDTPDRSLGRKRINLRVRGSEGQYWLTMKVSPGLFSRNRHEREELEIPWSEASLSQINGELDGKGVKLRLPAPGVEKLPPVGVMQSMGLQILQDRETEREARNIIEPQASSEILAELDIDSVLYHLEGQDVRLFELEIEAKSLKGKRVLGDVKKSLWGMFPSELRSWRFGKLVTGKKIERAWQAGRLQGFLAGTTLKPSAYDMIEKA